MANPWFRLYHEFDSDPKVQSMPEVMQRRLVMLFCSKCRGETLHETERAFHWRISVAELAETKAIFIEKGFIDEQWNVENWNRRQFLSDSSTDRVRRFRRGMKQDETLQKRSGNVTVTAPDTDTEAEQIQKQKKQIPSRGKREVHPLFAEVKELVFRYYRSKNSIDPEWNGMESKNLSALLASNPKAPIDHWHKCLINRFKSDVAHGDRPGLWISRLSSFTAPLNGFNRPKAIEPERRYMA